jgi:hypothetical protein
VNDASNSEDKVREWWAVNPNFNPAIALGPSGLVVYDFDGSEPFDNLPASFTVKTGREEVNGIGGLQIYFTGSCKTQNHADRKGEVRGRGMYVMAAGSIHPDTKRRYEVVNDVPLAVSPVQNEAAPVKKGAAVCPAELESLAKYIEAAFKIAGITSPDYKTPDRSAGPVAGSVKWIVQCPWYSDHSPTNTTENDTSSAVILYSDGKRIYACQHSHCLNIRQWKELRAWMDKAAGVRLVFALTPSLESKFAEPQNTVPVVADSTEDSTEDDFWASDTFLQPASQTSANPASAIVVLPAAVMNPNNVAVAPRTLSFISGSSVKPERVEWLWRGRILAAKLNVFSGEPDVGKGMTTADFAARITTHRDFPDCRNELGGCKDVLFLSSEDDMADTIVPRLIVAGADMSRIHFVQISENTTGTAEEGIVCLDRDLPLLEAQVKTNPDIVLIIPDPVIAFLGDADPNKDKEVRPIYSKMKSFAKRLGVAWLFVNHWNKNQNATSINKTSGAKTMVSAPRATWMFCKSPEDPTRYLMMKGKGNLSSSGGTKTLAYRIVSHPFDFKDGRPADPDGVPLLVWDGVTDHTCDEVLQDASDPKNKRSAKAEDLLTERLKDGAALAKDIYQAGEEVGISSDKMKRAHSRLGYLTEKVNERWYWAKSKEDFLALRDRLYSPRCGDQSPLREQINLL